MHVWIDQINLIYLIFFTNSTHYLWTLLSTLTGITNDWEQNYLFISFLTISLPSYLLWYLHRVGSSPQMYWIRAEFHGRIKKHCNMTPDARAIAEINSTYYRRERTHGECAENVVARNYLRHVPVTHCHRHQIRHYNPSLSTKSKRASIIKPKKL